MKTERKNILYTKQFAHISQLIVFRILYAFKNFVVAFQFVIISLQSVFTTFSFNWPYTVGFESYIIASTSFFSNQTNDILFYQFPDLMIEF